MSVAATVTNGEREVRVEVGEPRRGNATDDWLCTYRIDDSRDHTARGPDGLAAVYAALVEVENTAPRTDLPRTPERSDEPRVPGPHRRRHAADEAVADTWEFGLPLGARAVRTPSGPVVITIGRPRQDPNRSHTYLCPFRIDERTEAFGQGPNAVHAVMSAIRGVGAIVGIPRDWPTSMP
ncbi:DUF6968 family protein [Nocardia caishijiensis]|uniref:DUF6968 family protein n=1 Tax=Nocardia caishijiensis TaxID=184756 RepID=UPI00082BE6B6